MADKELAAGRAVHCEPIYTIDGSTGALADPEVSIYRRGTPDADARDIRNMPEEHFMQEMADVRKELGAGASTLPHQSPKLRPTPLDLSGGDEGNRARTVAAGADERHLNQFLA